MILPLVRCMISDSENPLMSDNLTLLTPNSNRIQTEHSLLVICGNCGNNKPVI